MKYNPQIVLAWFKQHGLTPTPELQFHPARKWRFDFAFEKEKVALEVQGGLFTGGRHSRGASLLKEHEKLNTAAQMGWRILYCIPQNLCMQETIDAIKTAIRASEGMAEIKEKIAMETAATIETLNEHRHGICSK